MHETALVGLKYKENCGKALVGRNATIRAYTVIYADVTAGDNLSTGHNVLIRENSKLGNNVVVGSGVVIDGNVVIGNYVKIESNAYIPPETRIGNNVFIGPGAVLTNDKYPQRLRQDYVPLGPIVEDGVTIGANVTILPGVRIGKGSFLAAGCVVTKDVPEWSMVKGVPATAIPLHSKLREINRAKSESQKGES